MLYMYYKPSEKVVKEIERTTDISVGCKNRKGDNDPSNLLKLKPSHFSKPAVQSTNEKSAHLHIVNYNSYCFLKDLLFKGMSIFYSLSRPDSVKYE